jgi:hypothetical protein
MTNDNRSGRKRRARVNEDGIFLWLLAITSPLAMLVVIELAQRYAWR